MTLSDEFDAMDVQRIGLLLLTAASMSRGRYVLIRAGGGGWRVNVRGNTMAEARNGVEHVASSHESLSMALERAVEWLRAATASMKP